ncbi:thiamine pyrophosphate-binding protein [Pectinatus haikarae]|uniref:Acetolactate synthase-1/2/3 large subunit n=1 Tax=Pectinatus haikarae TaxID=349096 RepID=A0ABT9YDM9_9FIRM|nr:thiamine pyrophosphate-binding protein [Pectinatus haikarae]MDQ0205139.1 acetolactate synthase-1/2/3 large subunit [Pectinatus haikarae]
MKIRIADYIAHFFVEKGIDQVFSVVGGGAMYLNDSLGHHPKLHCIYNHHEQAASIAAEAYARIHNKMALVCVTSGPGAINALNGVTGAYQDSIPMLVISGQTKTTLTVKYSGLKLRTLGNQEFDIISAVDNMTKYAEMIIDPQRIRYCLEKAYFIALNGRQGPCWLDIPLDIQGACIETDNLPAYKPENIPIINHDLNVTAADIIDRLKMAERPVLYVGNGIRLSGGAKLLQRLVSLLKIPVVTCWDSIDLIDSDSSYYCGRGGIMGDRAGNFAVQNSDMLICVGTRLNIYQVGYNVKTWARAAYTIVVDIDSEELKKQTIRADLPICADASIFMTALLEAVCDADIFCTERWIKQCNIWKEKYPVVQKWQYQEQGLVNIYGFMGNLSHMLSKNTVTVVANGSASVVGSQSYYIKKGDRFIMNCGLSSMGYGLPAAIGACIANDKSAVICIEGDGSIMMNLQELQTMVTNKLPIKLFVINNNGYHQIRQTQTNVFHNDLVGVGPDSRDLEFPNFKKVAHAFGIPYMCIDSNKNLKNDIQKILDETSYIVCEVCVSIGQKFEPKSATKRLPNGTLFSPPLEDMAPFLSREELKENMYIPLMEEDQ